jgi:hypothetical protein
LSHVAVAVDVDVDVGVGVGVGVDVDDLGLHRRESGRERVTAR